MRCVVCNRENGADEEFCKTCGTRLNNRIGRDSYNSDDNKTQLNQYGEYQTRHNGGNNYSEDNRDYYSDTSYADYSPGDRYRGEARPYPFEAKPEKKKGRALLISLIAVIAVLVSGIIALGSYMLVEQHGTDEDKPAVASKENSDNKKDSDKAGSADDKSANDEDNPEEEEITGTEKDVSDDISEEEEDTEVDPSQIKTIDEKPKVSVAGERPSSYGRYRVVKSDVTWYGANTQAQAAGGHLICINSYAELQEASTLAESAGLRIFWVGARRELNQSWSGVYWQDGTPLSMSLYWSGIEPTYTDEYTGKTEDCLAVHKANGTWGLNDTSSYISDYHGGKMGYIIEFD